jgi:multidrug efflux system membrane fusion protein
MRATTVLMLIGLAAPVLTGACSTGAAENPSQSSATGGRGGAGGTPPVPVEVASVVQQPASLTIQTIGSAEAYSNVAIHAQITGELTSVNFKEGDDVKKGQVLFTLDRRPLDAALTQAQANLERDEAQTVNAVAQAKRYQDLAGRGIATAEQVDQMTSNAAALTATVGADRAAIVNAQVQLDYATMSSPIDGRTGVLMVHAGNLVRANDTTPLVVINQVAPIYVTFGIPEARLQELKEYMAKESVRVEAQLPNATGPPSAGHITFVDNTVDPTTGTIKVKATFPNDDLRLWPGLFANVVVTLRTDPNAIVVPLSALQTGPQGQYMFIVKPDQTVELRLITVGRTTGTQAVITAGLKPGETVVTDGQIRLVAGSRISLKSAPPGSTP